jgi:hypothetical protein
MATKRVTAKQVQDEMKEGFAQILSALGQTETPASEPEQKADTVKPSANTVKLPGLRRFVDEKRAIGVDETYTSNVSIFRLKADGSPSTKRDGSLKRPTRIHVDTMDFILNHADECRELVDEIRANSQEG